MNNFLKATTELGQSICCDYISTTMIASGELQRLVSSGVRGVTSNPAIFRKAIADSNDYDAPLGQLAKQGRTAEEIGDALMQADVACAADVLRPLWNDTKGLDGYVSLEVAPRLADDNEGTVREALRLWKELARPNVMIKVPATKAGIAAIEKLAQAGVSINATLIFSAEQYGAVARAWIDGLTARAAEGHDVASCASVASVFVSRIDNALAALLREAGLVECEGKIAIDNARLIYRDFLNLFSGATWDALAGKGAAVQRPLWASTSVKNSAWPACLYVDQLIGAHTVNTVPPATLEAFMKSGDPADRIGCDVEGAAQRMALLAEKGIDLKAVTDQLLVEGLAAFVEAGDALLAALEEKRKVLSC